MLSEKIKRNLQLPLLILVVLIIRSIVASPYHVPTPSMEPTIKVGDRLLANKLAFGIRVPFTNIKIVSWSTPKRGDIIVFRPPSEEIKDDYVKRVVAIAGDTLEVRDNVLLINGEPQQKQDFNDKRQILEDIYDQPEIKELYREDLSGHEHWLITDIDSERRSLLDNFGPITIPQESVFVMGDNRDNSQDSRVFGSVPLKNVKGKAVFVLWSKKSSSFELRGDRFGYWYE